MLRSISQHWIIYSIIAHCVKIISHTETTKKSLAKVRLITDLIPNIIQQARSNVDIFPDMLRSQLSLMIVDSGTQNKDVRFGSKIDQIGLKWDKSGTFEDYFSVHFSSESQNVLKNDLQKYQICPFWDQSDLLWAQNLDILTEKHICLSIKQ